MTKGSARDHQLGATLLAPGIGCQVALAGLLDDLFGADKSTRLNELVDPPPETGKVGRLVVALQPVDEGAGIDRVDGDRHGARQADSARSSFGSWSKRMSR